MAGYQGNTALEGRGERNARKAQLAKVWGLWSRLY